MAEYRETRSALTPPLLLLGGAIPAVIFVVTLVLGIVVNPTWFVAVFFGPWFPPFLAYISLLWRNRRTAIVVNDEGIQVGTLGARHDSYQAPWIAVQSARIETSAKVVDAMMTSRRISSRNRYWGIPLGRADYTFAAGVLVPPFARAVLIVQLGELTGVEARPPKPRRYFSNYTNVNRFSHKYIPRDSTLWLVPTRNPEALASALAKHGFS